MKERPLTAILTLLLLLSLSDLNFASTVAAEILLFNDVKAGWCPAAWTVDVGDPFFFHLLSRSYLYRSRNLYVPSSAID